MRLPTRGYPLLVVALAALAVVAAVWLLPRPPAPAVPGTSVTSSPTAAPPLAVPPAEQWHGLLTGARFQSCSVCHWNPALQFYDAAWQRANDGWNLTVTPRLAKVALLHVEADTNPIHDPNPVEQQKTPWPVGQPWEGSFSVPAEARGVQAMLGMGLPEPLATLNRTGVVNATGDSPLGDSSQTVQRVNLEGGMHLALVDPNGAAFAATRLEDDRLVFQLPDPVPGTWRFSATVDAARPNGQAPLSTVFGDLRVSFQGAPMRTLVAHPSYANPLGLRVPDAATFHFPAQPDGGPPDVHLLAEVYHDHDPQLQQESSDLETYERILRRAPGPPPGPFTLSAEAVQVYWGSRTSYVLWDDNGTNLPKQWTYQTDAQGHILGTGDTPYAHNLPQGRLLPGATRLRIEATWNPPLDIPDLAAKVSPAATPEWFDAKAILEKAPGSQTWELPVDPAWWDVQPIARPGGAWDANVYRPLVPNTTYYGVYQFHLTVYAER